MTEDLLNFNLDKSSPSIIKVIGVGGGGGNAVSHMYHEGMRDVTFMLCNTDRQALSRSDIEMKVVLGKEITKGLGAGNKPEVAKRAAEESAEEIRSLLDDGTHMVFITAGMGGGTGTGAAPTIANVAKSMGILTVGIVTIPFGFEGERKILQALKGVEEISKNVDALLVINNERLRDIYPDLTITNAFAKADDTLTVAARSIADIITKEGIINLDFADVQSTLRDGGVAIISSGYGEGEGRLGRAIEDALHSPLLNNNEISRAKRILFNIYFSEESEPKMEEIQDVDKFMKNLSDFDVIWGTTKDDTLGDKVKITILASGFSITNLNDMLDMNQKDIRITEDELIDENERARKKKREQELIATYYGSVSQLSVAGGINPNAKSIVLSPQEYDDDTLINFLEDNPVFNRDSTILLRLRKAYAGDRSVGKDATQVNKPESNTSSGDQSRTIHF